MTVSSTSTIPTQAMLDLRLEQLHQTLRLGQRAMADWNGGELAVSAVPGAGKSTGMAVAAAIAIAKHKLHRQNQLVIVTFTRSAASNIRKKVRKHLENLHLPHSAFSVNTLHGLALNIASSHREISGFSLGETQIASEAQKQRLIRLTAAQWIKDYLKLYEVLLEGRGFDGEDTERLRRQTVLRTDVLPSLAREAIATAKSSGLTPEDLWNTARNSDLSDGCLILEIAAGLFETYNRLLDQQGMLDYDDMILGALRVLENESVRQYWQDRIFAVFEDEAQDSSPLQTKLLEILAGESSSYSLPKSSQIGSPLVRIESTDLEISNLIRVGDPNQAINSTFTTADPRFFNRFCDRCDRQQRLVTLDQAGRSTAKIMKAANFVLDWVNQSQYAKQEKPFRAQSIYAVDANDPQTDANPPQLGNGVEIYLPETIADIEQEAQRIGARIAELFESDRKLSIAILVRQHNQGKFLCDRLQSFAKEHEFTIYDVEQSNRRSRVPSDMLVILRFIERPHSTDNLKAALTLMAERQLINPQQDLNALASTPEQFLYPTAIDPELPGIAKEAKAKCTGLLRAKIELPLYNLIAFIAMTLDYEQGELATADKLGDRLTQELIGNYSMATMIELLQDIVLSENFEAVEEENIEDRYIKTGQLTVISLHKAKGLDWDVVFMPFLHDRICPGTPFMPEAVRFLGDYTLPEVARSQIRSILHEEDIPDPIAAWNQCNMLKQAEEFRLLYVGMTRAKRLLWISAAGSTPFNWNNLDSRTDKVAICPAIAALAQTPLF